MNNLKRKLIKLIRKIHNYIIYSFNNIFSFLFSRQILYTFNSYLYKYGLIGMGVNLDYNIKRSGEYKLLKKLLALYDNPIVFDVGANTGKYALTVKDITSNANIYAFEPHPINYKELEIIGNKHGINTYNLGLGEKLGVLKLYDYVIKDGSPRASIYEEVIKHMYGSDSISHEIQISTVDDFVSNHNINYINLLKIDVEGHELSVIKGARKSIENNIIEVIQFEFNYTNIISRTYLYDFFKLLPNYNLYRLLRSGMIKIDNTPYNEIFLYQNIIAIREDLEYNFN